MPLAEISTEGNSSFAYCFWRGAGGAPSVTNWWLFCSVLNTHSTRVHLHLVLWCCGPDFQKGRAPPTSTEYNGPCRCSEPLKNRPHTVPDAQSRVSETWNVENTSSLDSNWVKDDQSEWPFKMPFGARMPAKEVGEGMQFCDYRAYWKNSSIDLALSTPGVRSA